MAVIQCEYYSNALCGFTSFAAILPIDLPPTAELPPRDRLKPLGKMLHPQEEDSEAAKHRHENEQNISHRWRVLYQKSRPLAETAFFSPAARITSCTRRAS